MNRLVNGPNGRTITRYTTAHGLTSNTIYQLLADEQGFFWISCHLGVYRVRKQELNDFAAGWIAHINSTLFDRDDGFLNPECTYGGQPAGFRAHDGKLLFPTHDGLARIDPQTVRSNPTPPPLLIEECLLDHQPAALQTGLQIKPGQGNLEINYTALSFIKSEQIRFRYKLEGLDQDWVGAGTRRTAYYPYLLAAELHDSLGQNLIVIKNWATLGLAFTEPAAPVREQLDEISTTAVQSLNDVRAIIHNLRPYQLDTIGLSNTLRFMVAQVGATSGLQFHSEIAALDNLFSPEAEVILFRIVQECVTNIVKHAQATEAKLSLKIVAGNLQMVIADNGRGMDAEPTVKGQRRGGLGLTGLGERVRILHGTHKLQSTAGQGTQHIFTIPIPVMDPSGEIKRR